MSEPINDINNKSCCSYIDDLEDWWNENKYRMSSRLSIGLGLLSSAGSALVGIHLYIPASIILGCVSAGVFFTGIALSKYENENKILIKDNESLKQEMTKRLTMFENFKFPGNDDDIEMKTPTSTIRDIKSNASTNTHYEEVISLNFGNNDKKINM